MTRTILLIALLVLAAAEQPLSQKAVAKIDEVEVTLIQEQTAFFTKNIKQHQNLSFMVNMENEKDSLHFGQLEIELSNNNNDKVICAFKYPTNICVLQNCTQKVGVRIKCLKATCKTKLSLSQRYLYNFKTNTHKSKLLTVPGQIYKLQKQQFNSLLEIHLQKKEAKLLQSDVKVYSNVHAFQLTQVEQLGANNLVFGLKPIITKNDQYIYLETERAENNKQLRFNIITHQALLKEGITLVDFIETFGHHSKNSYQYAGLFSKNIQLRLRVFAPKENKNVPFAIKITGKPSMESKEWSPISQLQLNPINFNGHKFYDIVFLITKSGHQKYKIIDFELGIDKVDDKALFVEVEVGDVAVSDVVIHDHVFFATSQKEEITFLVRPQVKYQIQGQDKQIDILRNGDLRYQMNLQSCSLHKGCEILLKTQDRCEGCSFTFDVQKEDILNTIIYYEVKQHQIQAVIDFEEELYFKYLLGSHNYSQVIVNSPNVIIYAQFQDYVRCNLPTSICHQYAINQYNPMIVHNQAKAEQNLIINVVGIEKTSFKVRFIDQINGLELKLGEKFTYLFDNEEQQITVTFNTDRQTFTENSEHLYFNLIAPTNSLLLKVKNLNGKQMSSIDGYVQFPKKMILGDKFEINIKKQGEAFLNQFVHMTLIVTTADRGVKLDSTTTHYQKYLPMAEKKFIIEYEPSQENAINIYTQNLEKTRSTMKLSIVDLSAQGENARKQIVQKILQRDNQMIDLDQELQNVDICEDINCELQVTIKSQSKQELEQSIIVLHQESVIALDDSIWNSYEVNELSTTNHFFYIPRQLNKTITVLFSTEDRNIYIEYSIHNTKDNINPQNWPWDRHILNTAELVSHLNGFQEFKIQPNNPDIQACWPNCVILITINTVNKNKMIKEGEMIKNYKILVSSTIVEAPQDIRFQVTMKTNQQNAMFIDIKNFLKAKELTFFTESKVGRAKIVASLVSKGVDYKIKLNEKEFVFSDIQTHLPIQYILQALKRHDLKVEECLLKINFKALSNLKMYFEFTSSIKNLYRLNMDDLEVCVLNEGEEIWYEFLPERDFSIKFYRARGFPLFKIIKCKEESYIDCLSKHKKLLAVQVEEKLRTKQKTKEELNQLQKKDILIVSDDIKSTTGKDLELFVEKNFEYNNEQCEQCIIFIWIYAYAQDLQMSINIRSSSSEMQLKQMAVLNDRITFETGTRKYLINSEPEVKTIVTFRVIEGVCRVEISDNENVLHNGTYSSVKNSYSDIPIDPLGLPISKQDEDSQNQFADATDIPSLVAESMRLQSKHHVLRHIHVKIISLSEKPIDYLLSYSIGYSGVFLQDGVMSAKNVVPNVPHIFYYHNLEKSSHPYLSLSSKVISGYSSDHSKNQYEVKFYYYPDASNRQKKEEFRPQMPPKKNNNFIGETITHVYELPAIYELYQIQVFSTNYLKLQALINHKEIVYLPLGFEYLIKLHPKESIYMMVDRPDSEYLELTIKKCDTSVPSLLYTNDAKEFQKGLYEARQEIYNSYEKKLIKTKKSSKTIHFKLTAEDNVESLFSVTVLPENRDLNKIKSEKIKAGNNGLLTYTALDTNKIEVEFSPLQCEGKGCTVPRANYYLLLATSAENIYGELYCAGNYIISKYKEGQKDDSLVIALLPENFDKARNVYKYKLQIKAEQEFIGVKAMYSSNSRTHEVVYVPTEVTSLWKNFSKLSFGIVFIFGLFLAIVLTIVVVVSTKIARRGYKPIAESQ